MSHIVQQKWCKGLKLAMPRFFKNKKVLEMGSLNVNGTLRDLFKDCNYTGVDVIKGKDVDRIGAFHELKFKKESFDVVCSVNSLEHDMHWEKTLPRMYELLKPGGLIFLSASASHAIHGVVGRTAWASGTAQLKSEWAKYYKNLHVEDFAKYLKYDMFKWHMISVCHKDVQFVGIK